MSQDAIQRLFQNRPIQALGSTAYRRRDLDAWLPRRLHWPLVVARGYGRTRSGILAKRYIIQALGSREPT
jgi:hypothetical protein